MRVTIFVGVILGLLLGLTYSAAVAGLTIYTGQSAAEAGIVLGSWGSGSAEETSEEYLTGTKSIQVKIGGWFEGGSLEFKNSTALFTDKPGHTDYFVLTIKPTMQTTMTGESSESDWYAKTTSGGSVRNFDFGAEAKRRPKLQRLRLVFTDEKGYRAEFQPGFTPSPDADWMNVSIPLTKLHTRSGTIIQNLKRLLIFADSSDTIYIGAIKVVSDSQAITADPGGDLSYAAGDSIVFKANASAGLSNVRCEWDFDNSDGLQVDAVGQYAKYKFSKSGDFIVTLTVNDVHGLKAPLVKTVKVHIE